MRNSNAIERIRLSYDALGRHYRGTALADMDENVEWHQTEGLAHGGVYHGIIEVRRKVFEPLLRDCSAEFAVIPNEYLDAGDEVIALGAYRGPAKRGGSRLDAAFMHMWSMRNGKAGRTRQSVDRHRWIKALDQHNPSLGGLAEGDRDVA